jgi:TonB family protein
MHRLKFIFPLAVIVGVSLLTATGKHQTPKKKLFVDYSESYVNEVTLRHQAITTPMPEYPEEAIAKNAQGLVDVAVLFDEEGKFKGMKVLESPNPMLSKAVEKALKDWTVRVGYNSPYAETRLPLRTFGELRFRFVIAAGVARVENSTWEEQIKENPKFAKISSAPSDEREDH